MQSGPKQIGQSFTTTYTQETTSGNKPNERNKQNSIKRETSVTVDQLHNISAQEKMKRLAVSRDGHPEPAAPYTNSNTGDKNGTSSASHAAPILNIQDPFKAGMASQNLTTILSTASDDFNSKYELVKEIGKGGFSTVYQCRNRIDGGDFAVKVSRHATYLTACLSDHHNAPNPVAPIGDILHHSNIGSLSLIIIGDIS